MLCVHFQQIRTHTHTQRHRQTHATIFTNELVFHISIDNLLFLSGFIYFAILCFAFFIIRQIQFDIYLFGFIIFR